MNYRGRNMVLSAFGSRRSRLTRTIAGALAFAMVCGSLRMGWATSGGPTGTLPDDKPRRSSERIRPVQVADVAGKAAPDALWRLFDGDARTAFVAAEPVKVRLTFAQPVAVDAVGAFGAAAGVLALRGSDGADASGASADLAAQAGRWTRILAKDAAPARTYVVEWTPREAGVGLPELEIWGRTAGSVAASSSGAGLAEALYQGLPEGAEQYAAAAAERRISHAVSPDGRTFSFSLPMDPASVERAFLVYDLADLPHFTAAARAINGNPAVGGFGAVLGAKGGLQVEEIARAALRRGENSVRFEPVSKNPGGYRVSHLRLVVTHADAARATSDRPDLDDGRESTGWDGRGASARRWHFPAPTQPRELELRLTKGSEGTLVVVAGGSTDARNRVTVDLGKLDPGWHKVALDALPPVDALTMGFAGGREGDAFISELAVTGSPLPAPADQSLRVTYPLHGECVNHQVHVRGLAMPAPAGLRANGVPVKGATFEPGGFSFTEIGRAHV